MYSIPELARSPLPPLGLLLTPFPQPAADAWRSGPSIAWRGCAYEAVAERRACPRHTEVQDGTCVSFSHEVCTSSQRMPASGMHDMWNASNSARWPMCNLRINPLR